MGGLEPGRRRKSKNNKRLLSIRRSDKTKAKLGYNILNDEILPKRADDYTWNALSGKGLLLVSGDAQKNLGAMRAMNSTRGLLVEKTVAVGRPTRKKPPKAKNPSERNGHSGL